MTRRSLLLGIGAVGAFLAVDLGAIAYANNWIGSARFTRQAFIDRFQSIFGLHPGFRRNHAKGVAVSGHFDSNGAGRELSTATVLRRRHAPPSSAASRWVAAIPPHPMTRPRCAGLGLAIGFAGPPAVAHGDDQLPRSSRSIRREVFYDQLLASKPDPKTGKPDPGRHGGLSREVPRRPPPR